MPQDFLGPGAGPISTGTGGAGFGAYAVEAFESPILDLTTTALGVELVPARPFYTPRLITASWLIEKVAGTQTSPPTVRAGNDAAHGNFIGQMSTTPSNANTNAAATPCVVTGPTAGTALGPTVQTITNAPVLLDIVSGATGTGGFMLKARLVVLVLWFAPSS